MEINSSIKDIFNNNQMVQVNAISIKSSYSKKGKNPFLLKKSINKKDQREQEEKEKCELLDSKPDIQKEILSLNKELIEKEKRLTPIQMIVRF